MATESVNFTPIEQLCVDWDAQREFLEAYEGRMRKPFWESPDRLSDTMNELESLLNNRNAGDYVFRPTDYAYERARQWLLEAYTIMGHAFIRPSIVPDGEGGIDIEWAYNGREVLLSCRVSSAQQDYIYYQVGDEYGAQDASLDSLRDRLDCLIQA